MSPHEADTIVGDSAEDDSAAFFYALKVLEEGWVNRTIPSSVCASYQVGRLVNANEWLRVWETFSSHPSCRPLIDEVNNMIRSLIPQFADKDGSEFMCSTIEWIDGDWKNWIDSERYFDFMESCDDEIARLGTFSRRDNEIIFDVFKLRLSTEQFFAFELGYLVDEGVRCFCNGEKRKNQKYLEPKIELSELSELSNEIFWISEISRKCGENSLYADLCSKISDVNNLQARPDAMSLVEKLDDIVWHRLLELKQHIEELFLGIELDEKNKVIRRGADVSDHLGEKYYVIESLCNCKKTGYVSHDEMEKIYREKLKGKGEYPAVFYELKRSLNVILFPLDVKIESVKKAGWKLVEKQEQSIRA